MATPYFQVRLESVASTQDEARDRLDRLPVAVIAASQSEGRGRSGAGWLNADRAVAVSVALLIPDADRRPLSLIAGVAVGRTVPGTSLKWPNDVMLADAKIGGILVERSENVAVIGLGLNLWWAEPPDGMGSLLSEDPGADKSTEMAAMWTAHLMALLESESWPLDEYKSLCETIGRAITWEPGGAGEAVDVADDGGLVVLVDGARETVYSGAVRYVR